MLTENQRIVLNELQGGLPVRERPFRQLEDSLGLSEPVILETLRELDEKGFLSRFGAVLNTRAMGGDSRLAAMNVPDRCWDSVVEAVNDYRTVTHNYRRNHSLNLWFVLSAAEESLIDETVQSIEDETGLRVYNLPKLKEYYVGLRFRFEPDGSVSTVSLDEEYQQKPLQDERRLTGEQRDVVLAIQDGLPIRKRPYQNLAKDMDSTTVRSVIRTLLEERKIKRLGCVPNHYALGIRGNGMLVMNVPDDRVDEVGERLGDRDEVTHCYRRPRHRPVWPYNFFAMVHDRTRDRARQKVENLLNKMDMEEFAHEVLFSEELLKKTGLRLNLTTKTES
jgi:DNA-binding Lrp family transcriptional regulator